jgi:DNA-3-methyladenine glycosylase I
VKESRGQRAEGGGLEAAVVNDEVAPDSAIAARRPPPSTRCSWPKSPLDIKYHDTEWGVPVHDDRLLFELLTLEGAQAGLSWSTILKKRGNYRRAFDGFDPEKVARFTSKRVERLLSDPGIVRHRGKIESTISNARKFIDIQQEFGTFDRYVWRFVDGSPVVNNWQTLREIPSRTRESDALSKDLKRRGFRFVGSTICYAFMQAGWSMITR